MAVAVALIVAVDGGVVVGAAAAAAAAVGAAADGGGVVGGVVVGGVDGAAAFVAVAVVVVGVVERSYCNELFWGASLLAVGRPLTNLVGDNSVRDDNCHPQRPKQQIINLP